MFLFAEIVRKPALYSYPVPGRFDCVFGNNPFEINIFCIIFLFFIQRSGGNYQPAGKALSIYLVFDIAVDAVIIQ